MGSTTPNELRGKERMEQAFYEDEVYFKTDFLYYSSSTKLVDGVTSVIFFHAFAR